MKVLIVGGVAGGASCAARLRRLDESAEIIMFERGEYISMQTVVFLLHWRENKRKSDLTCRHPRFQRRFNVDVRILNEVVSINREDKRWL